MLPHWRVSVSSERTLTERPTAPISYDPRPFVRMLLITASRRYSFGVTPQLRLALLGRFLRLPGGIRHLNNRALRQLPKSVVQPLVAGSSDCSIYLAIMLLLKAMKSLAAVVRPLDRLLLRSLAR
jgi:hypothetical protein